MCICIYRRRNVKITSIVQLEQLEYGVKAVLLRQSNRRSEANRFYRLTTCKVKYLYFCIILSNIQIF